MRRLNWKKEIEKKNLKTIFPLSNKKAEKEFNQECFFLS